MPRKPSMQPVIRVIPPAELNAYIVYEHQLDELAQGSWASISLNFALFFLGLLITAFGTIFSVTPTKIRAYVTFRVIALGTLIAGVVLLTLWLRLHRSTRPLLEQIKSETSPEPAVRQGDGESVPGP